MSSRKYSPSSDTPTHLELYKKDRGIKGIAHTHSTFATGFAQECKPIAAYGTTHADYFYGDIPCTRPLRKPQMEEYEKNTGKVINETFEGKERMAVPACLVANHGVFAWGKNAEEAVYLATVVEEVAKMAFITENIPGGKAGLPDYVAGKHYFRKHGKNAYYGQNMQS